MADQVIGRGKGLSMPENPARALQEMMLAQMDAPATGAETPLVPGESDSKTVRRKDSKTERQQVSHIKRPIDSRIENKLVSQPSRETGSERDSSTAGDKPGTAARQPRNDPGARQESSGDGTAERARAGAAGSGRAKSKERTRAEAMALDLAATPMRAVGLKMPEGLHDWLDDCQHRLKKQGILKQDLLKRALQLLVVEVEGGEKLTDIQG